MIVVVDDQVMEQKEDHIVLTTTISKQIFINKQEMKNSKDIIL